MRSGQRQSSHDDTEPRCPQLRRTAPRGNRVGEQQHVDETATALCVVGGRRRPVGRQHRVDDEPLAARGDETPQRAERRVSSTVLVGGDDGLRGAGAARQFGLGEAACRRRTARIRSFGSMGRVYRFVYVWPTSARCAREQDRAR